MTHPLDGAEQKIERARHHLNTLDAGLDTFTRLNPYGFFTEFDDKTGHYVIRARQYVDLPGHLSTVVGDIVHNLRSALDHTAYQLAFIGTGPGDHVGWPIIGDADNAKQYGGKVKRLLEGVVEPHWAAIHRLQPYHARKAIKPTTTLAEVQDRWRVHMNLWAIGKLDNLDKHIALLPVAPIIESEAPTFRGVRRAKGEYPGGWLRMEDNAVLFTVTEIELLGAPEDVKVDRPPPYGIVFGDPEHTAAQIWTDKTKIAVSAVDLRNAADDVQGVVRSFWGAF